MSTAGHCGHSASRAMGDTVGVRRAARQIGQAGRAPAGGRTVGRMSAPTDRTGSSSWHGAGVRVPCVGAVVTDADGRLLLVQRANEPGRGLWSIPGGRVEPGETARQAVVREVAEETRLPVVVVGLAGVVERAAPGGGVYVIEDYVARLVPGTDPASLEAGDDALAAAWVRVAELDALPCVEGLLAALRDWRCLP